MNATQLTVAALTLTASTLAPTLQAQDWTDRAIAPVANPIFFESPLIQSEVRPLFAWHRLDQGLLGADVDVRVYAAQIRWAVTERLAIIATKDGYIEVDPEVGPGSDGWADLAAGVKYAIYKDDEQQCYITPGVTFEFPTGNSDVFQGNGDGEVNVFVSAVKGWGDFHATVNLGARVPLDSDEETSNVRYCAMLDYYVCRWFIPFVSFNAFTTVSDGNGLGITSEGFDLINFGSANASGETQGAVGVGFRSRLRENLDLGLAFEWGVIKSDDIFKDRLTVDLIWRF